jgi:hypothetical protein
VRNAHAALRCAAISKRSRQRCKGPAVWGKTVCVCGEIKRKGRYETKNGHTIKRLGRPGAEPDKLEQARALLAAGNGIRKVGKMVGLGTSTVQKLKNEMVEAERPHSELAVALEQSPPFFVCLAPRRAFDLHPTVLLAKSIRRISFPSSVVITAWPALRALADGRHS